MTDGSGHEGFAPADYSDGRDRYEWASGYPEEARSEIKKEAAYCAATILLPPVLILLILKVFNTSWFILGPGSQESLPILVIAWLSGTLGGAIYSTKWLYHTVGKGWWHMDRRLWRLLTPHISGAVSSSFIALSISNILPILSFEGTQSVYSLIGISFLLGYFSDTAVAKLSEIAGVLFGTVRDHEPEEPDDLADQSRDGDGGT